MAEVEKEPPKVTARSLKVLGFLYGFLSGFFQGPVEGSFKDSFTGSGRSPLRV